MATQYASAPTVLQTSVFSPDSLSSSFKEEIACRLWPQSAGQPQRHNLDDLDAYFGYLKHECSPVFFSQHAMQNFGDLFLIVRTLCDNPTAALVDIRNILAQANSTFAVHSNKLSASIQLAVRLWLMVNIQILMPSRSKEFEGSIPWPEDQSLVDVLQRHMSHPSAFGLSTVDRFPAHFNATDMRNIANFQVLWTNNLAEHLVVRGSFIYMFHQVSALRRLHSSSVCSGFLPEAFIHETLSTLSLLIPHSMAKCNVWLKDEIERAGLDRNIMYRQTADRDRRMYPFWSERLSDLSETFQRTKPSNPIQWWYDRRDMGQWWGFWLVAVGLFLTVLFGLVQSITGILQVAMPR
ncbi:hypothetical protein HJFPF1_05643 [Paramyrothecium foliicola]|nr:hypothetical protein HJFPF1_05643 [Paramyrothecium foliicola]